MIFKEEDLLKYIYNQPLDPNIKASIDKGINEKSRDILEQIYFRIKAKEINKFKSYEEHLNWISDAQEQSYKELTAKFFPNKNRNNSLRYTLVVLLIIALGAILYFIVFQSNPAPVEEEQEQVETPPIASAQDLASQYFKSEKPDLYPQTMGTEEDKEKLGVAYREGDYTTVIDVLEKNNEIKIETDRKALVLGISYNRLGQSDKAITTLEKINIESSYWDNAQWEIGVAFLNLNERNKAEAQFLFLQNTTEVKKYKTLTEKVVDLLRSLN